MTTLEIFGLILTLSIIRFGLPVLVLLGIVKLGHVLEAQYR